MKNSRERQSHSFREKPKRKSESQHMISQKMRHSACVWRAVKTPRIENHYVEVKISADPSAQGTSAQNVPAANSLLSAGNVSLLSDGITLGASTSMPANQIGVEGGWKAVRTGSDNDNRAQVNGSDLYLTQYDKNKYSMLVTNNRINFTGIKNLRFSMNVGGDGSKFTTWLDTDTDQTFEGSYGACYTQNGKSGWAERDLNVASVNESLYLKFSTKATAAGKHNPKATIGLVPV